MKQGRMWDALGLMALAAGILALTPGMAFAATADLSVAKSDGPDPVTVGSELTYTIAIANAGPETGSGVELEDMLPNRHDFVSAVPSQGTCELRGLAAGPLRAGRARQRRERLGHDPCRTPR